MLGKVVSFYPTKKVYVGYAETISINAVTNEPQVVTKLMPLFDISEDSTLPNYQPISPIVEYYSIVNEEPIIHYMKDGEIKSSLSASQIKTVIVRTAVEKGMEVMMDSNKSSIDKGSSYTKKRIA